MNSGKYVFAQITEFLPQRIFDRIVNKYDGNKYIKHFSCWNQLLLMIFGQLTNRESLRDLIVTVNAHKAKAYHLGFGKQVSRSNLSKANCNRSYKIFEEFAFHLIDIARSISSQDIFKLNSNVYAFDSSTIDLCLNVFWWAKFRSTKGGIKLHTLYDLNTHIPVFVHITPASVHDMNVMDHINYESGAYYVFDRGYVDYYRLFEITQHSAFFVIRAKSNLSFRRLYSRKVNKANGVMLDQIGMLTGYYSSQDYPGKIRKVKFHDQEHDKMLTFLTNNFDLSSEEIAFLYKHRWQIELFFKWIKQHLKIKSFWGNTENAVRIQIYTAIISYCLVAIIRSELKIEYSTYEILQVLGISMLDKTPINELLKVLENSDVKEQNINQLKISLF